MTELNRSERMLAEKTVCVLLVRGESPEGTPIYAYLAVRADRLSEFMIAQQGESFSPEDYGVIIASGEGEPDDEVRARMEGEYNFNHSMMLDVQGADQAQEMIHALVKTQPST